MKTETPKIRHMFKCAYCGRDFDIIFNEILFVEKPKCNKCEEKDGGSS